MTREERLRFIDEELKGLWPQWEPREAEIRVWMNVLAGLDPAAAREALQQCFCAEAGNYRRPKPAALRSRVRVLCRNAADYRQRPLREPTTNVYIECRVPPAHRPNLAGARTGVFVRPLSRQSDPDYLWSCAEAMRKQFEQLYGGQWIAVRTRPTNHRDDPGHHDDDLQGAPGRQKAHQAILTGPETPAKQWLQTRLIRTTPARNDNDPTPIAETLNPPPAATETGEDSTRAGQDQFWREEPDLADIELEQNRRRTYA